MVSDQKSKRILKETKCRNKISVNTMGVWKKAISEYLDTIERNCVQVK